MGANGRSGRNGGREAGVMACLAAVALSACAGAGAQPGRYAALSCRDSLPTGETGPYRPAVVCLTYGASPTTGARSAAPARPAMKAMGVDGRVFFVDARRDVPPEALLHP